MQDLFLAVVLLALLTALAYALGGTARRRTFGLVPRDAVWVGLTAVTLVVAWILVRT